MTTNSTSNAATAEAFAHSAHVAADTALEALHRAERAATLAGEAVVTAESLVAATTAAHATAVDECVAAENAWQASQTTAGWTKVTAARSVRDQATLRMRGAEVSLEGTRADHGVALARVAAARGEHERASTKARDAALTAEGYRLAANARDDAAAKRAAEHQRDVDAVETRRRELVTKYTATVRGILGRYIEAAQVLQSIHAELEAAVTPMHAEANATATDATALRLAADDLSFGASAGELAGYALHCAGTPCGAVDSPVSRLARGDVRLTATERAAMPAVNVEARDEGLPSDAMLAELHTLARRLNMPSATAAAWSLQRALDDRARRIMPHVMCTAAGEVIAVAVDRVSAAKAGALLAPSGRGNGVAAATEARELLALAERMLRRENWR